jgi:multidrug efflux system membrane fusion protein
MRVSALTFTVLTALAISVAGCSGSASGDAGSAAGSGRGGRGRGAGAQPVVAAKVTQKDVPVDLDAVGNVEPFNTIAVRSQVTGTIETVGFNEGDFVKKGALLFTIDRRPLQAAQQQAEASLARSRALLNQAEAQLARDTASAAFQSRNAERQGQLVERGLLDKNSGEQARAQAEAMSLTVAADKAAVESARAELAVQESAVSAARLELNYTTIRSPIDGRTGNLALKAGNLVTANTTQLVTVAQIEPVLVTFTVPATHLPTIVRAAKTAPLSVVATPQEDDESAQEGKLVFWDNVVDPATDTIKLKASMPNSDHQLWPGQFVRVRLRLETLKDATVVPQQALQIGQDGQFVFVVRDDMTVEQRPVTVAQRAGDDVVVLSGLTPGESVVTDGQLRLEHGTHVQLADASGLAPLNTGRGGRGAAAGAGNRRGGRARGQ